MWFSKARGRHQIINIKRWYGIWWRKETGREYRNKCIGKKFGIARWYWVGITWTTDSQHVWEYNRTGCQNIDYIADHQWRSFWGGIITKQLSWHRSTIQTSPQKIEYKQCQGIIWN